MNEFETMCAKNAHAQEIASSRVGNLGSSDAAMVMKIGQKGINALSNTDIKRLRVMLSLDERDDFGGNAATNAGHLFEDYVSNIFSENQTIHRELKMCGDHYINFQCIAHADYAMKNEYGLGVYECKFVQKTTDKVVVQYYAQLQWYYMLGADKVALIHGTGVADPFKVDNINTRIVERDDVAIAILREGLRLIDLYCEQLRMGNQEKENENEIEITPVIAHLFSTYRQYAHRKKEIDEILQETTRLLTECMQENGVTTISYSNMTASYRKPSISRRLDAAKVQSKYPQVATDEECWKTTNVKSSITIKFKENESENN